ncbi:myb-like transcription factor family protein [Actinidia rufa]|uniref:Myb-like transcription factor family protein n=1 Tax=Actinidia rufa TaxID=165716 RepID=A0A7J0EWJ3_9ERIC|nr:myb-like transcription factor family protein [Actinidia rufa]
MGSIPPELSLDIRPTFVPKTISCFLGEITTIGKISERMFRIDDFVKRLEDEMRKIDAFKRELPLSMMLLNDAIVILKEESMQCRTTNIEPVLEEFIPLKKNCDEEEKIEAIKGGEERCKKRTGSRAFMSFDECLRKEDKGGLSVAGLSLGIKNPRGKVSSNGLVSKTRGIRPVSSSTPNSKPNLQAGLHRNRNTKTPGNKDDAGRRSCTGGLSVPYNNLGVHKKYRLHARKPPAAANKSTVNFRGLWLPPPQDDRFGESAKQSNSKSESPQGPLQLDGGGTCTTGEEEGDDGDDDDTDDEDEKSESYGWKIHIPKYGN